MTLPWNEPAGTRWLARKYAAEECCSCPNFLSPPLLQLPINIFLGIFGRGIFIWQVRYVQRESLIANMRSDGVGASEGEEW